MKKDIHLKWSGLTDKGRFRKDNEDAFRALYFNATEVALLGKEGTSSLNQGDFVFAVSDGMGGANAGEFASRIAVEEITKELPKSFKMTASGFDSGGNDLLIKIFERIHEELLEMGQHYEECKGMGATLSLCWVTPQKIYFAHIGDSRIYYFPKGGSLTQVSHDHSRVGSLRRSGKLNEREARNHPQRNILDQALGGRTQQIQPQVGIIEYSQGDQVLLCSDGIIDGIWDHHLEDLILNPNPVAAEKTPSKRLIDEALYGSGRDNMTALVFEFL